MISDTWSAAFAPPPSIANRRILLYLTTACPGTGPFAPHPRHSVTGPLRRNATAIALLFVLAAAAPRQAGAVNSLLPPEGPSAPPMAQDASGRDTATAAKARKTNRRGKTAVEKATVVTATADRTVPPLVAPVQAPAAGNDRWDIVVADRTLNAAMARWAAAAGWQLLWELPVDYAVQAQTSVPGKFEDAVTVVVNSMEGAEIPMKAIFYSGNKVLRIMAKGAQ
jgi:Toxin co-regulated pilus biosynthesis protein Q